MRGKARPCSWRRWTIIRLHEPSFGEDEIAAVVETMRSTDVTAGEKVRAMEAAFEEMYPGYHAVMCNSGSSANLLAVAELCSPLRPRHLKRGDHVIVSALSWSTTVWPWVQYGLRPIIVDIDPDTLNIDPEQVKKYPEARAIMPVHVYGNPCDMDELQGIAADNGMHLVEDCCEAMGATLNDRPVGSFGATSTFSFYFSHHITTIEGGMVITQSAAAADRMRMIRAHGWTRDCRRYKGNHETDPRFTFVHDGYNLRASELNAAIGLVQLLKLERFVANRRHIAEELKHVFRDLWTQRENGRSSWFGFCLRGRGLRRKLEKAGVETRSIICGNIARQPGMGLYPHVSGDLPHADRVMQEGFSIGCHQGMTVEDVDLINEVVWRS